MSIREAYEKLEALKRELGHGYIFATTGKYATRLEFIIMLPNDQSMLGVGLPEPPPEKAQDF